MNKVDVSVDRCANTFIGESGIVENDDPFVKKTRQLKVAIMAKVKDGIGGMDAFPSLAYGRGLRSQLGGRE